MSNEEAPARKKPVLLLVVIIALLVVSAVFAASVLLRQPAAAKGKAELVGEGVLPILGNGGQGKAPLHAAGNSAAPPARPGPLPALIPGSPLNDEKFAQLSALVVIAAMGLKQDKDWETNVAAYMQQELKKQGISIEDYTAYAKALYDKPDRGRAVAENIQMRAQKKLGYRVSLNKLPMFKFDQGTLNKMQQKLK
jgi:hypothetical protein